VRLLAEDGDVVAEAAPRAGERARVDVRAGAPEEVAVPEEDLQKASQARAASVSRLWAFRPSSDIV
jgi:hypothetical protein